MFKLLATTAPIETLTGRAVPRERTPVRRHSFLAGRCEGTFWRRVDRREARRIVIAAKRYDRTHKPAGSRNGPLGHIGLQILEFFAELVNSTTGRLDPSLDYIAQAIARSRPAIVAALKALRTHGFLDWLRRYVPTGEGGKGPRVQQTSNAYRLHLPPRAAALLGRQGKDAPPPDDFAHAQEQRRAEVDAYRAAMTDDERTLFDFTDDARGVAESLNRLRRHVLERELPRLSESGAKLIL